jgi:uncharacterized membrane-anchored protein
MGLRLLRRRENGANGAAARAGTSVEGTARLDRRTKRLTGRLHPGNIAVIDHHELDRIAAESLLEHGVAAVVNASSSVSPSYPNLGPMVLVAAGVPVLDGVGAGIFDAIAEGDVVRVDGDKVWRNGTEIARGTRLTEATIRASMDAAHAQLSQTVERFAENTLEYVRREQDVLLQAVRAPDLRTTMQGRHALVVTRGYHYKEDLHALRGYIREVGPVVIAVDGAADACLAEGIRPDIVFGDMDSLSTEAMRCGAELIVHAYPDGTAPGLATLQALGVEATTLTARGTSEDVAMLLAAEQGAELVVAVGSHTSLIEFLDKGRQGMASTFLARLRLGPRLVDAKGVSLLYRTRIGLRDLMLMVAAAVTVMVLVVGVTEPMRTYWVSLFRLISFKIRGWF